MIADATTEGIADMLRGNAQRLDTSTSHLVYAKAAGGWVNLWQRVRPYRAISSCFL